MTIGSVHVPTEKLDALCRKWKIHRLEIFGSAATGELRPDSDVDLLAEFEPDEAWSLMDMVRAEEEFAALFDRRVDLVDKKILQSSENWIRRDAILESAELIFGA